MKPRVLVLAAALVGLGPATQAEAQALTPQDLLDSWDLMTEMVVASAKLMPSEHYGFTPGAPLRNFADQINHTTRSNLGFAAAVNAGPPAFPLPDPSDPPRDKAGVVDLLEKSFAHFRSGLATLSPEDLATPVPWGPQTNRRNITRLKAFLIVSSHLQREHGKTMMYLRAQGIAPAPAGSWKVGS